MPNIKPISELKNYKAVLDTVAVDSPVYRIKMAEAALLLRIWRNRMKDIGKKKKAPNTEETSSTPYDDVFHTLLNDCSHLIIPIINEIFHEHYRGDETIVFHANEHYINTPNGQLKKQISDSCFDIQGETKKKYHTECQSVSDNSMLVRMFEYGTQIALDEGKKEGNVLEVEFPHAAVLFLRSTKNTPDSMKIHMKTPGGEISYDIPVMKVQDYTLEEIFEKNLLFLIPFYIFNHESRLKEYDTNPEKLETLKEEYEYIKNRLEELCQEYKLDAYTRAAIHKMSNNVVESLAVRYENVKEEVMKIMGGKILDYEAKQIKNEGRTEANIETAQRMLLGNMQVSLIVNMTSLPKEKVEDIKEELIRNGQLKEKGQETD